MANFGLVNNCNSFLVVFLYIWAWIRLFFCSFSIFLINWQTFFNICMWFILFFRCYILLKIHLSHLLQRRKHVASRKSSGPSSTTEAKHFPPPLKLGNGDVRYVTNLHHALGNTCLPTKLLLMTGPSQKTTAMRSHSWSGKRSLENLIRRGQMIPSARRHWKRLIKRELMTQSARSWRAEVIGC